MEDGVSFPEAVRALGRRVGIEVESRPGAEDASENEALFKANSFGGALLPHRACPFARGRKGAPLPRGPRDPEGGLDPLRVGHRAGKPCGRRRR